VLPDGSIAATIVFDTGIVTGDAQAVQTFVLTGTPVSEPTVPALGPLAGALLIGALMFASTRLLSRS
jgi:hypothetical protein